MSYFKIEILLRFNYLMATEENRFPRCIIPLWGKRAVKYRDGGKCACCGKDLSGILDCEDENSVHYDHILLLNCGGLNDISNIQLLCSVCNLKQRSRRADERGKVRTYRGSSGLPFGTLQP